PHPGVAFPQRVYQGSADHAGPAGHQHLHRGTSVSRRPQRVVVSREDGVARQSVTAQPGGAGSDQSSPGRGPGTRVSLAGLSWLNTPVTRPWSTANANVDFHTAPPANPTSATNPRSPLTSTGSIRRQAALRQ